MNQYTHIHKYTHVPSFSNLPFIPHLTYTLLGHLLEQQVKLPVSYSNLPLSILHMVLCMFQCCCC